LLSQRLVLLLRGFSEFILFPLRPFWLVPSAVKLGDIDPLNRNRQDEDRVTV